MEIEKVAKAIVFLRKRAGYTQKDLAERLGVSDKAVSKWERGLGMPDVSCLRKLSILLDTDTDSLLAGDVIHHDSGWHGVLLLDQNPNGIDLRTVIYDKPLVYFLLGYFLLVGIRKILVICTEEERAYLQKEFGNGKGLGISLLYDCEGVDQALQKNASFEECSNFMIVHGRSVVFGVDQTRFFQKAMIQRDHLTVLSLPKGRKAAKQRLYFDDDKKIISDDYDGELNTQYDYYDIPVLFCPRSLFRPVCEALTLGPSAVTSVLQNVSMYTEVLDRGFVEISVDTWDDVMAASNFVKIVQQACNMHIYCIEEIAWRRGIISTDELKSLGQKKAGTEYGRYILSLSKE